MSTNSIASQSQQILKTIRAGDIKPVYLLMGEESYYIDLISNYIKEKALQPHEREFNQSILYGLETDPKDLVSVVKRYPMMAERQLVILKEAQRVKDLSQAMEIIKNPVPSTVLVIEHKEKNIDKRSAFWKTISKTAVVFQSDKLRDYDVPAWIRQYCKLKKIGISEISVQLLAEHIGTDLSRVVNELDKIAVALPEQAEITPAIIEKHVGISKDFNAFELQNAIGTKNAERAFKIVKYMSGNLKAHPLIGTTAILFGYFTKVYQYHFLENKSRAASVLRVGPRFAKDYELAARNYSVAKVEEVFGHLLDTDLRAKGVNKATPDDAGLLQELVAKILH